MITTSNISLVIYLPILSIILTILFYLFFEKIIRFINIYDDSSLDERKIHLGNIPSIGGIIFFLIFSIYFTFNIFLNLENKFIFTYKEQIIILITSSCIFFVGLIDDKNSLSPLKKSIIFIFIILVLLLNNPQLQVKFIRFETIEYVIVLNDFTIFFTMFCIFCFMNAFNMFDGINLQSGFYLLLFFLVFAIKNIDSLFFISLLIPLILFLYLNYNNRVFLGNSGTYFLSFLLSIYLIKSNVYLNYISVEEILILLLVPGLDMFRLFLSRFSRGKSPFLPDKNHLHHLLLKKFNQLTVSLIIIMITIIPYLIFIFFFKSLTILFLQLFLYLILIYQNKIRIS
ncbi:MraY family glycosyltransferase [Candidatus Pelagibacter sp.]|nr:MraY family glycosyltransferase [Candidatus Pelagibacter sp.]